MLRRDDLEPLLKYTAKPSSPVLSLYLDVDLARPINRNRGILTAARALLTGLRDDLGADGNSGHLDQDFQHAERFLESYDAKGKSLVLFADASEKLLWHRTLPVRLHPDMRYRSEPYVRPLLETLDEQERYGIVLLDRQQARFFTVFLGEIREHREAFASLDVRTTRTTGTDHLFSEKRFHRRANQHAHQHIKQVASMLRDLQRQSGFDHLVIAGPVDATSELHRLLPRTLAERVVAVRKKSLDTPESGLLKDIIALQEKLDLERENQMMQELLAAAAEGHQAAVGLAPTLEALRQARILRLIYVTGGPIKGGLCTACGTLAQRTKGNCKFCQGKLRRVLDLVARMARAVVDSGGRLDRVHGPSAAALRKAGGVGALLRF